MDLYVYLTDQRVGRVVGCTGDPVTIEREVPLGTYRDIFTLPQDVSGLNFPGTFTEGGGGVNPQSQQVPDVVTGRLIPQGNVTIAKLLGDSTSELSVNTFEITLSDEIAHIPPRTEVIQQSYWAFPVTDGNTTMHMYFVKSMVTGWGNAPTPY